MSHRLPDDTFTGGAEFPLSDPPPDDTQPSRRRRSSSGEEATAVHVALGNFDYQRSCAFFALQKHFGRVYLKELKGILMLVIWYWKTSRGVALPPRRNFRLMIKYMDINYHYFVPILPHLTFADGNKEPILLADQVSL
jgi:hypothetical protein